MSGLLSLLDLAQGNRSNVKTVVAEDDIGQNSSLTKAYWRHQLLSLPLLWSEVLWLRQESLEH